LDKKKTENGDLFLLKIMAKKIIQC